MNPAELRMIPPFPFFTEADSSHTPRFSTCNLGKGRSDCCLIFKDHLKNSSLKELPSYPPGPAQGFSLLKGVFPATGAYWRVYLSVLIY